MLGRLSVILSLGNIPSNYIFSIISFDIDTTKNGQKEKTQHEILALYSEPNTCFKIFL